MGDEREALEALRRCQRGDVEALGALYDAYGDQVYRLCLSVLGNGADAEDAAQEVFLRIFDKAALFEGRSKLSTWIHRLTVNHCLNLRRARGRRSLRLVRDPEAELAAPAEAGGEEVERRDEAAWVRALMERLPESARAILALREVEGLSYAEIAEVLDVPQGTVMSRLSRARKRLAELLRSADHDLGEGRA